MRVRILMSAHNDLVDGYWFYERQGEGLGGARPRVSPPTPST